MSGKGSGRRKGENAEAIRKNWPFPDKKKESNEKRDNRNKRKEL